MRLKITELKNEKKNINMEIPFVITVAETGTDYLIIRENNRGKYAIISLDEGYLFLNYLEEQVQEFIKNGKWIIRESEMILK